MKNRNAKKARANLLIHEKCIYAIMPARSATGNLISGNICSVQISEI